MYLTMTVGVTCGMSLSGPISASCAAERNRSVGAIDPRIGVSGPLVVVQQREQRGLTLRPASLSIRDIGSALGLSRATVQRELDAADPASLPNTTW